MHMIANSTNSNTASSDKFIIKRHSFIYEKVVDFY
jgi:hypothetical protein